MSKIEGSARSKSNMQYWQLNKAISLKYYAFIVVGLVLCVGSFNVVSAEFKDEDPMLRKLYELHLKLANQGNVESITRLGMMYESGEGVKKDRNKAIELYQSAATQGYQPAIELLVNITANKSNDDLINTLDDLRVPTIKKQIANDNAEIRKQKKLEDKLRREQGEAEAARQELERLRQSKQEEEEKQRKLLEEIQNVKKVQEQLAQEREKAEAARREMELLRKRQQEELKKQQVQQQALESQKAMLQQGQAQQSPVDEKPQVKEDKPEKTFSSNPCNTPAAKFMSTCN